MNNPNHPHLWILLIILALFSQTCCTPTIKNSTSEYQEIHNAKSGYCELLQLEPLTEGRTLCRIFDPWRTDRVMMQYLLVPKTDSRWNETTQQQADDTYGASIVVRTPLQRMALTSSCHAWLLDQLDALGCVKVMCDTAFVAAQSVKTWMYNHEIADGGPAASPNIEVLLAAQSDALWVTPFENFSLGNLSSLSLPIIYCAEYMETSPLGRAEWMRFYGRLVGKDAEADSLFSVVANRYEAMADSLQKHPKPETQKLLAELPYSATWYVPGGQSTAALLYGDAGYDYLWKEDRHAGSLSLSKEAVLAKAIDCDLWLMKYNDPAGDWTLESFGSQDPIYSHFKAYRDGNVWGCNTASSDFFDVTPFRPDSLLVSLAQNDGAFFRKLK